MSTHANNNKETFKLLDVTTDSESDNLQIDLAPKKKRIVRSRRDRNNPRSSHGKTERWGHKAMIFGITASLLAWLAILSWAAAALSSDTRRLDAALREVSMGSQGVGDALQRCHSTARELQHNHTEMAARLDHLILRTDNLSAQVAALQSGLSSVQQQVASAPELVDVPQQLSSLGTSVAGLGSHFKDFDSTVAALREQSTALTNGQNTLNQNITQLKEQIDQMLNKSFSSVGNVDQKEFISIMKKQVDFQNSILQITNNISLINETLATKIDWATQDFKNDHHKVTGLLESVQNNSAALSSLQALLRKNYDSIIHNVTELAQELNDKSIEVQREILNLKQMIHQLETTEAKQINADSNTMSVDVAASKDDSVPEILPQQVIPAAQNMFEKNDAVPKITTSKTPPLSITKATSPPQLATHKPSILV